MRVYRILPFIVVLLIGTFMMNHTGSASSASQPEVNSETVVAPDGVSISGPLDVDQGDSATYTINYSAVSATGGVQFQISGMAFSDLEIVSMSPGGNVGSDRIVWPFDTIGASGSITIEVKHNDCGAITHNAVVLDTYADPSTTMASASITTLVACVPPIPEPPTKCEGVTIRSTGSGNWNSANSWQEQEGELQRVPNRNDVVWIQEGHDITASSRWWTMRIKGFCNEGTLRSRSNRSVWVSVTDFAINFGEIIGQNGSSGGSNYWGRWGSSVGMYGYRAEITNHGLIQAGHGGDGRYAGTGGRVWLFGGKVFNSPTGKVCSGNGGNTLGSASSPWWWWRWRWWARGGDVSMWGWPGFLVNEGEICSGNGGNGNPAATVPQRGGDGGCIWLMSRNLNLNGGNVIGGVGGLGAGGGPDGRNGGRGCIRIDPEGVISVRNGAKIEGGDIAIYGGDNWVLDLSDSNGSVISATEGITLAVGTNGIIDLRGNTGAILQTEQEVTIYSDEIRLDEGSELTDVISAGSVDTQPARVLRFATLVAPQLVAGEPGTALPVEITAQNNAPEADTYDLTIEDSESWTLSNVPDEVTVEGLSSETLEFEVTPPLEAGNNTTDIITVTLTSQSDPTVIDIQLIEVVVEYPNTIYLPAMSR